MDRVTRRSIIPNPYSDEEQARRFHHDDLDALTRAEIDYEHMLVSRAAARRSYFRLDRVLPFSVGGRRSTDVCWMHQRARILEQEYLRRGSA